MQLHDLFVELEPVYPDLKKPCEEELEVLDEEILHARKREETTAYMFAAAAAVFFCFYFPVLLTWGYDLASSMQGALLPYLDRAAYLRANSAVSVGLGLAAFAAFVYAFVMPARPVQHVLQWCFPFLKPRWDEIETSDWRFRVYQAAMLYFALGIVIFMLYCFASDTRPYSALAARIWFFLPLVALSIVPTVLLIALLAILFLDRRKARNRAYATILRDVLLILQVLKDVSAPSQLLLSRRLAVLDRIARAAASFRDLYLEDDAHLRVALWARHRMNAVADNFVAISAWIAFPKADSITSIKRRLVFYANVLGTGSLDELPADAANESLPFVMKSTRRGYLRRLAGLMWLLLLVAVPVLVYATAVAALDVGIPAPLQTPAAIAYSAWVAACLLAHIEELAPEARETLLDVVKLVFRH